ncbi:MAG: hypothetical protein EHM72_17520, partial [Calditrichaeota bacterium]
VIVMVILNTFALTFADALPKIASRQIHLDFHTSEYIPEVGKNFSKAQFQEALKAGHVNSINVFGKGHHGWSYYPTKIGKQHPNLSFDLLGAEIDACHEIGVLAPIYFTVGWSVNDARNHPEWCARNKDGSYVTSAPWDFNAADNTPKPPFHWINMCVGTDYHLLIMKQVEEICQKYAVDGFWFDIYQVDRLCYCASCMKAMLKEGVDTNDVGAVAQFNAQTMKKHQKELSELIRRYHPAATIFFNGTTAIQSYNNFWHKMYEYNTMQDLEDLPTTWGGYDKLPIQSKFFLQAGYIITAMSGKFHTSWGEFGGFKHPNAIKYEAASMISWGANCNFGDQLHPSGLMDMATYKNIGAGYSYVEKIEEYGIGGKPIANIALWRSFDQVHDEGLAKMLLEGHVNFDIANGADDLSQFDVILIPGIACLSQADADKINDFARQGGGLVVLGEGALDRNKEKVILDIGASYLGKGRFDIDYLVVGKELNFGLVDSPFLNYESAIRVKPEGNTKTLAAIREPYFSRTYLKYSSHQNTPYQLQDAEHPGILQKGNVIFFAHDLDKLYYVHGARLHRDLFLNAVRLLDKNPMVQVELPSAGRVSLLHQPDQKRYVLHLLYGPPIQRGRCEVIEDLPFLYNVKVSVELPKKITKVYLVPDLTKLQVTKQEKRLVVTIPQFQCHCGIVYEYLD